MREESGGTTILVVRTGGEKRAEARSAKRPAAPGAWGADRKAYFGISTRTWKKRLEAFVVPQSFVIVGLTLGGAQSAGSSAKCEFSNDWKKNLGKPQRTQRAQGLREGGEANPLMAPAVERTRLRRANAWTIKWRLPEGDKPRSLTNGTAGANVRPFRQGEKRIFEIEINT